MAIEVREDMFNHRSRISVRELIKSIRIYLSNNAPTTDAN